jgi:hypothetical protein
VTLLDERRFTPFLPGCAGQSDIIPTNMRV